MYSQIESSDYNRLCIIKYYTYLLNINLNDFRCVMNVIFTWAELAD